MTNNEDATMLGFDRLFTTDVPFRLTQADRRQHIHVIGASGTGKSTLLLNLFAADAASGRGVALIDPHGDLAHAALGLIPPWRSHDVVYLNPSDLEHPVGFNVLEGIPRDARAAVASNITASFRSLWANSWGPRLEHVLYSSLALLLDQEDATLVSMVRLLDDAAYRERLLRRVHDPIVRRFWRVEYPDLIASLGAEVIQPLQNKLGALIGAPALRNVLGQVRSTFNARALMDEQKILICNLSKGALGETHAALLGSLVITVLGQAAMSRADSPEHTRRDFGLLVDEFQTYTTDALASLLSEARKYHLSLALAHQYLDQLTDKTRAAILGNVSTSFVFRVGAADARLLAEHLGIPHDHASLMELERGHARARLLINGEPSHAIYADMMPPPSVPTEPGLFATQVDREAHAAYERRRNNVIAQSRRIYSRPRKTIEAKLDAFLAGEPARQQRRRR